MRACPVLGRVMPAMAIAGTVDPRLSDFLSPIFDATGPTVAKAGAAWHAPRCARWRTRGERVSQLRQWLAQLPGTWLLRGT